MAKSGLEQRDALVVGGNIRGLVATHVLDALGYRTVLLERGREVGGADRSFVTAEGTRFDYGMHVLDYMRSEVATRLFTRVVEGQVHRVTLRRAIVLRRHVIPYVPVPSELPPEIAAMLLTGERVDDIDGERPTRARLGACYGPRYADLVYDEILPSYPCEARHALFGVDESELLGNIYPWFFPRARRSVLAADESRAFHDQLRAGIDQQILYPREGGFGGFANGFVRSFDPARTEVVTGATDIDVTLDPGTHTVMSIETGGRRFAAPHVFWAAGWAPLCDLLGLPCQRTATDRILLGSFRFDRPVTTDFHELLVGDPSLGSNRIYFPSRFRGEDQPLIQVEYGFPVAEARSLDAAHWRERWRADFAALGLIGDKHNVVEFDFKTFDMHFNAYGMEGERLVEADPTQIRADSNIRPVIPSLANLNLNRYVPRALRYVTAVLAAGPDEAGKCLPLAHPAS